MGDVTVNAHIGGSGVIELTGKITVVAIVLLLFIVAFVYCIHLYAKWFWYRRQENPNTSTMLRRRLDSTAGQHEIIVIPAQPLEAGWIPSSMKTMPAITYNPKQFKEGLECAVCLSEVSEGEKARFLPKCSHGFHLGCIDMWLQSHFTCPLCRSVVSHQNRAGFCSLERETILEAPRAGYSSESANFPTNVLIWGDESTVSSLAHEHLHRIHHHIGNNNEQQSSSSSSAASSSMAPTSSSVRHGAALAIEIPRQMVEEDERKSPIPTRLRSSLKRLLSGEGCSSSKRVNPSSSRNLDLEQSTLS